MNKLFQQLLQQAKVKVPQGVQSGAQQLQNIYNKIPTAINPFATRNPTTRLGQLGKTFNPLNPTNLIAPGASAGTRLATRLGLTGLGGAAAGIGGNLAAVGAWDLLFPNPTASGTLDDANRMAKQDPRMRPLGPPMGAKNQEGKYWAGANWGYQSPESYNMLYGTQLPTAATPEAPPPPATPGQRADAQERSRIAQLTEQDPLFKKYRVAELTDAYNKAKGDERERIGLEIWATTNPSLAKEVPPGQVGYRTSAAMSGTQVFGSNMPGITQATYQQASEGVNNIPYYGMNVPGMSAYGLGANAQQIAFSPSGQPPISMIGENVFNKGFDIPSSENLTQTQLALLKRAFEGRLK